MRIYSLFMTLILVISLTSCDSDSNSKESLAKEIADLEAKMEESPTAEEVNELIKKYNTYTDKYPEEKEWGARYMYRAGSIFYRNQDYTNATTMLDKGINNFEDAEATPNSYLLYASLINEKVGNPEMAAKYYKNFLEKYPNHNGAFEAYTVCKKFLNEAPKNALADGIIAVLPDTASFNKKLKALEDASANDDGTGFKKEAFSDLSAGYEAFATLFPENEAAPSYWYKMGECEMVLSNVNKGMQGFSNAYSTYPDTKWGANALFMMAFTYEERLNDDDQAKKLYTEFLEKYPDAELAAAAKSSIENLGLTPEEIIERAQAKNKNAQ